MKLKLDFVSPAFRYVYKWYVGGVIFQRGSIGAAHFPLAHAPAPAVGADDVSA